MNGMDRGEFIKGGYSVEPGDGGSFVVWQGSHNDRGFPRRMIGFSNWLDLVNWLTKEHSFDSGGHADKETQEKSK